MKSGLTDGQKRLLGCVPFDEGGFVANITLQLEEQLSDLRSNEIAYRFAADNKGTTPVQIRSLTPRMADGVSLLEVRETSERAIRLRFNKLCQELTTILKAFLERLDNERPGNRSRGIASLFRPRETDSTSTPTSYSPPNVIQYSDAPGSSRTVDFVIEEMRDAETALSTWFHDDDVPNGSPEKRLFTAKLTQLRILDEQIAGEGANHSGIAMLAPGSLWATTYVFRFARGTLDPRKYTVTIEACYVENDGELETVTTGAVSTSTTISPPLGLFL